MRLQPRLAIVFSMSSEGKALAYCPWGFDPGTSTLKRVELSRALGNAVVPHAALQWRIVIIGASHTQLKCSSHEAEMGGFQTAVMMNIGPGAF